MTKIIEHERFAGVYWVEFNDGTQKLATVNSAPGTQVYGEKLIEVESVEYRLWDPYRSKLAAAIVREVKDVPIASGSKVLYLGAASGTTASHVSDLIGPEGVIYCVEISSRPMRDLLLVCNRRPNMVPMLADATKPSSYCSLVGKVDVIYQDVAHPEQSEILFANAKAFLREGGYAMLALKARSIDVTKEPREIFRDEMEKLEREFEILDTKVLEPYEKDHAMFLMRKGE
jgi:fibrillarin-like pre-rRNA processing protein